MRDCAKSLAHKGVAPEDDWPYDPTKFAKRPLKHVYREALKCRVTSYARVAQTNRALRVAISQGLPVAFGFYVYESFEGEEVARAGKVPMPGPGEECLGGHAVVLVGYDDRERHYVVRNSWGRAWGDGGHCYMPYEYVESRELSSDFWVIKEVTVA